MSDNKTADALKKIIQLIRDCHFSIKLNIVTGDSKRAVDRELLTNLNSTDQAKKGKAILETIYSIRCNMFHGHKGFDKVQLELLQPIIIILEKTIKIALDKLRIYDR